MDAALAYEKFQVASVLFADALDRCISEDFSGLLCLRRRGVIDLLDLCGGFFLRRIPHEQPVEKDNGDHDQRQNSYDKEDCLPSCVFGPCG